MLALTPFNERAETILVEAAIEAAAITRLASMRLPPPASALSVLERLNERIDRLRVVRDTLSACLRV